MAFGKRLIKYIFYSEHNQCFYAFFMLVNSRINLN